MTNEWYTNDFKVEYINNDNSDNNYNNYNKEYEIKIYVTIKIKKCKNIS